MLINSIEEPWVYIRLTLYFVTCTPCSIEYNTLININSLLCLLFLRESNEMEFENLQIEVPLDDETESQLYGVKVYVSVFLTLCVYVMVNIKRL